MKTAELLKSRKGAVLLYTMMVMMILAVVCVSFTLISVNMYKTTASSASKEQAFLFAKSVGQAFAKQLAMDYEAGNIVSYLEEHTDTAATVTGTAAISFNHTEGTTTEVEKYKSLTDIDIPEALVKFYFKTTCSNCHRVVENASKCSNPACVYSSLQTNKKYLYMDVTVSYNGSTQVVTSVFTYLNKEDFSQTMYDLFSVYNIYSTFPSEMTFNFAVPNKTAEDGPNVYLYNGTDAVKRDENGNITDVAIYRLETDIKANLTSTGDIKVTSANKRKIDGKLTSYGAIRAANVSINTIYSRGQVDIESTSTVTTIYGRSKVNITGSAKSKIVNGTIYAMGDVTISNATVGSIVGGPDCNVTLSNSICSSINTMGKVSLTNSTVTGSVYCGRDAYVSSSTVGYYFKTNGDLTVYGTLSTPSIFGPSGSGEFTRNTVYVQTKGNAVFYPMGTASLLGVPVGQDIIINGSVIIGGYTKSNTSYLYKRETIIHGNLQIMGAYMLKDTATSLTNGITYFSGLKVLGNVIMDSSSYVTDIGGDTEYVVPLFTGVPSTIMGTLYLGGSFSLKLKAAEGDGGANFYEKTFEETTTAVDYSNPKYSSSLIDLNNSTLNNIITDKAGGSHIGVKNGSIKGTVTGLDMVFQKVSFLTSTKICARRRSSDAGYDGNIIFCGNTTVVGGVYASGKISLRSGSILPADESTYLKAAHSCVLSGIVYGLVASGTDGAITAANADPDDGIEAPVTYITSTCVLGGNSIGRYITVTGTLDVQAHNGVQNTTTTDFEPRLTIDNSNGNTIYVNGTAKVYGWVYNLYVVGKVLFGEYKPYVKGDYYEREDVVFIGKSGLTSSVGGTFQTEGVIVYVYETPTDFVGDITISGTLLIAKDASLRCKSLKTQNIIGEYTGVSPTDIIPGEANINAITKIKEDVERVDCSKDAITVSNLNINGDFQLNMSTLSSSTVTFKNCTINGWFKASKMEGNLVLDGCKVTGSTYTEYSGIGNNNTMSGSVDASVSTLILKSSYVGGSGKYTYNKTSTATAKGNVVCNILEMDNSRIFGEVYCSKYVNVMKSGSIIDGKLVMNGTGSITWDNGITFNCVFGTNISLTINNGGLCGKYGSNPAGTSNLSCSDYFVHLKSLNCSSSYAVVGNYVTVYLVGDTNYTNYIRGTYLGNIYSKGNVTFQKGQTYASSCDGYVSCKGIVKYDGFTPSAVGGLYAANGDENFISGSSLATFNNISGKVYLPNYTGDVAFNTVGDNLYAPKASVTANVVKGDNTVKNITINISSGNYNEGYDEDNTVYGRITATDTIIISKTSGYNVDFADIKTKRLIVTNTDRYLDFEGQVQCNTLVCNTGISSYSTVVPPYAKPYSGSDKISFHKNVYVTRVNSTDSGNAFLSNVSSYGTLYCDGTVYANDCLFKSYGSRGDYNVYHCETTGSNTYRQSYYGSIYACLNGYTSSSYNLYLLSCKVYSHIYAKTDDLTYIGSSTLGDDINYDSISGSKAEASKYYYFGGSVTLSNSTVGGIYTKSTKTPEAFTLFIAKSANLEGSSRIGSSNYERASEHTGFKGIYTTGNLTIGKNSSVTLNVYCNRYLYNYGSINLQKATSHKYGTGHTGLFSWGQKHDLYSYECCGGIVMSYLLGNEGDISLNYEQHYTYTTGGGYSNLETSYGSHKNSSNNDCSVNNGNMNLDASYYQIEDAPSAGDLFKNITMQGASGLSTADTVKAYEPTCKTCSTSTSITGVVWESVTAADFPTVNMSMTIGYFYSTDLVDISGTAVGLKTEDYYYLNTENRDVWMPMAIPLKWNNADVTTAGENIDLNSANGDVMSYSIKNLGESLEAVNNIRDIINDFKDNNFGDWIWDTFSGELKRKAQSLFNNAKTFFVNLPTAFIPSSSYVGLNFKNKEDAKYYRVSASNINTVKNDTKGKDMLVITRNCLVVTKTFPDGDWLDKLNKWVGWNKDWCVPTDFRFNKRPVGLVFFNSGYVSSDIFSGDTRYGMRSYEKQSSEKDSEGRWYWGDNGGEGWYGTASPSNDVIWTFFTCTDPSNPYKANSAKDLHIILPKNTKLVWEKDKDSCVNIIGNGRVFLYLQDDTDIKVVGNGFTNWLHDATSDWAITNWYNQFKGEDATYNVFGGVRYVKTTSSGETYYTSDGKIVMDEAALSSGSYQLQPRMYIIGTGGNISFEVADFQTAAYVYMPTGYNYGQSKRNSFKISATSLMGASGSGNWDVYGVYVCDNFMYSGDELSSKVNYIKTVPDLSNTAFYNTNTSTFSTSLMSNNKSSYMLSEFWDYPQDLPVSSMEWYYRGISAE